MTFRQFYLPTHKELHAATGKGVKVMAATRPPERFTFSRSGFELFVWADPWLGFSILRSRIRLGFYQGKPLC
jgi:hypothetical protein